MKSISDLLGSHAFFEGLAPDAIDLISGCGQNVHFEPDASIISENDPADVFYVLRTGRAAIEIATPRQGQLTIETVGPGEVLGVSWLLPPYRWTFDVRAVEPTSAIALDAACLRGKCDDDPAFGYEMYKRFAGLVRDRLQATRLQLVDLYGNDAS
ncbi:MAG: cyclic nucleotide-binding domain-containing protein [Acidimicrobiia bacterium]|nr:cyclic nucleotide-binding domain-containing protein [Acidimicrobiia bacterium]